jgi:hypothetical protein
LVKSLERRIAEGVVVGASQGSTGEPDEPPEAAAALDGLGL